MNSILIGNISNIHGMKGEVKIYPYTDDIDNLASLQHIYLDSNLENVYHVLNARIHKSMVICKLKGINNIDDALALKGKDIYTAKLKQEELEEDTYYIEDLLGSKIIDETGNELGILVYVMNNGASDVYEVQTPDNEKIYLPVISQVVKRIDIDNKKIYVEIMEGLL